MPVIEHIEKIRALCKASRVKRLYVFGSVLTEKFNDESDVDLLVDFEEMEVLEKYDCYFSLQEGLEEIFKRRVDLISSRAITNEYFRAAVDEKKQLIYES